MFVNKLLKNKTSLSLIIAVIVYSMIWSAISLLRYYTFHASVFDLGLTSSLLYRAFSGHIIYGVTSRPIDANKMIYFIIAPFYDIYPHPSVLLVFQSVFISIGAIPLYKIGQKLLKNDRIALILSLSYLLYYPLSGVNWFDFHFMALFPTLFLMSIYLWLYNKNKYSLVFVFLAAISDYLVPFILLFYFIFLISRGKKFSYKPFKYALGVLFIAIGVLAWVNIYYGISYTAGITHLASSSSATSSGFSLLFANFPLKALYILLIGFPVLFIFLIYPEASIMLIPYIGMEFLYNYLPYFDPVGYQYPALIIPVIFFATILGLKRLNDLKPKKFDLKNIKKIAVMILVLSIVSYSIAVPLTVGISINSENNVPAIKNDITVNYYDRALSNMIRQVPKNSEILIQDNMPQAAYDTYYHLATSTNITYYNYSLTDPYSIWFDDNISLNNKVTLNSMTWFNSYLLDNYSIIDEEYGMIFMAKNNINTKNLNSTFMPYSIAINTSVEKLDQFFIPPGIFYLNDSLNRTVNITINAYNGFNNVIINKTIYKSTIIKTDLYLYPATITSNANITFYLNQTSEY